MQGKQKPDRSCVNYHNLFRQQIKNLTIGNLENLPKKNIFFFLSTVFDLCSGQTDETVVREKLFLCFRWIIEYVLTCYTELSSNFAFKVKKLF